MVSAMLTSSIAQPSLAQTVRPRKGAFGPARHAPRVVCNASREEQSGPSKVAMTLFGAAAAAQIALLPLAGPASAGLLPDVSPAARQEANQKLDNVPTLKDVGKSLSGQAKSGAPSLSDAKGAANKAANAAPDLGSVGKAVKDQAKDAAKSAPKIGDLSDNPFSGLADAIKANLPSTNDVPDFGSTISNKIGQDIPGTDKIPRDESDTKSQVEGSTGLPTFGDNAEVTKFEANKFNPALPDKEGNAPGQVSARPVQEVGSIADSSFGEKVVDRIKGAAPDGYSIADKIKANTPDLSLDRAADKVKAAAPDLPSAGAVADKAKANLPDVGSAGSKASNAGQNLKQAVKQGNASLPTQAIGDVALFGIGDDAAGQVKANADQAVDKVKANTPDISANRAADAVKANAPSAGAVADKAKAATNNLPDVGRIGERVGDKVKASFNQGPPLNSGF